MRVVQRFFAGLGLPFIVWTELTLINGRRFIVIPIMLNICMAYLIFRYGVSGWVVQQLVDYFDAQLHDAWQWVVDLLYVMFNTIALIFVTMLAVRLGTIIGSPFYGIVAERIDDKYLVDEHLAPLTIFQSIRSALWYELRKVVVVICFAILGFVLGYVPFIGVIIGSAFVIVSTTVVTLLDFTDVPMSRRGLRFRQRFAVFRQYLPELLGFAVIMVPLASIPVVNVVAVPIGISGGALLFVKYLKDGMRMQR